MLTLYDDPQFTPGTEKVAGWSLLAADCLSVGFGCRYQTDVMSFCRPTRKIRIIPGPLRRSLAGAIPWELGSRVPGIIHPLLSNDSLRGTLRSTCPRPLPLPFEGIHQHELVTAQPSFPVPLINNSQARSSQGLATPWLDLQEHPFTEYRTWVSPGRNLFCILVAFQISPFCHLW